MGRNPGKEETKEFLSYLRSGRDQMDVVECSISGADKNPDFDTRSIVFARECKHPVTKEIIDCSWVVSFSAEYGRPTPKDDDVFVALLKVSQVAGLMNVVEGESPDKKVPFSSYQLIKTLQWGDDGRSYKAIDDALNRIGGVFIVAKNYRWDAEVEEFFDAKFHIIDKVFLYERDKYDKALRRAREEGRTRPTSAIWWSDVMLESFQAGNVRRLDLETYNRIANPIGRKFFRYLGKQFWVDTAGKPNRRTHRIGIQKLCHDKLGYKQTEKRTNRLKQKVNNALDELVEKGIYGLSYEYQQSYGKCDVVFTHGAKAAAKKKEPKNSLLTKLLELRVRRSDAELAIKQHTPERIIEDIEDSGFREKHDKLTGSRAGCLAAMLKSEEPWERPKGFVSSIESRRKKQAAAKKRAESEAAEQQRLEEEATRSAKKEKAFAEFLRTLGSNEVEQFAAEALKQYAVAYKTSMREARRAGDEAEIARIKHDAMKILWDSQIQSTSPESSADS